MTESTSMLTRRGFVIIGRLFVAFILLLMLSVGFWMLNQVLDAVVILGRSYVDVPGYPAQVSVWVYHDAAYTLLWVSYVGLVLWEITPWKPNQRTVGRVLIALFGFALLTAGLWLSQDLMNAVLVLHRPLVDFPFFITSVDWYATRDVIMLLTVLAYIMFYALIRVSRPE
ncbi:MAG: hypothetical protein KGI38_04115 [Thaumarchaeota archaeon]|nr:hypothetical protein [Nitrososphaerota archaeon]